MNIESVRSVPLACATAPAADIARAARDPAARPVTFALASYLRWIPRTSSRLRLGLVCWVLRRLMRLRIDSVDDVPSLRAKLARLDRIFFRVPSSARRTPAGIAGVAAEWIEAEGCADERVVLYLHGGGFAFHFAAGYAAFATHLSHALRARVLLVDYRLAPSHAFPAPQDDCANAYRALLAQGVPAHRIVVAGDSAGGNLTLGLLHRLERDGLPQPACAVALSPVADVGLTGETLQTLAAADPMLPPQSLRILRDLAFAKRDWSDPTASPLRGDFARTAPVLVLAGTREVLLDDACRLAQRAHETGGRVVCEVWQDMPHVFPLLSSLKESRLAMERIVHFVDAVNGASTPAAGASAPAQPPTTKEIPCLR